jgi:hypothetical protein
MGVHRSTGTVAPAARAEPGPATLIDLGVALDLLATAVRFRGADFVGRPRCVEVPSHRTGRYANDGAPDCIVGHVLAQAGVELSALEALSNDGVDEHYAAGRLPCPVTLGALAVLRAAQRSQDRGCRWGDVLDHATRAAYKILDLVPDAALRRAAEQWVRSTSSPARHLGT